MMRYLTAIFLAILMSACGGGDGTPAPQATTLQAGSATSATPAMPAVLQAALRKAVPQAAISGAPLSADEALNWTEVNFPNFFPTANKLSGFAAPYSYRYYPQTDTYLGVATASDDVAVYLYGAINGWNLQRLGALKDFTCLIKPLVCNVSATPASVSLATSEGGSRQIDLDIALPPVSGTLQAPFSPFSSWLGTQVLGTSTVRVTANSAGLPAGSYQGEVVLQFKPDVGALVTKVVPVTFNVGPGLIAPAAVTRTLNAATPLESLAGTVQVIRGDGASEPWTAASSQPWLTVTPSGSTPGTLNYAFASAAMAGLPNFAKSSATVTINSPGVQPTSFQVTLDKQLPYLTAVMPYGITAGATTRVVVRGVGLSQYAGGTAVSGVASADVQVQSDKQLVFNATPQAAGNYSLRVVNAAGVLTSSATLKVAAADAYVAASVDVSGNKYVALHDPVRQAIYAIGGYYDNTLYKYQYAGGQWTTTALPLNGPDSLALSPDGTRLFVTRQTSSAIKEIDPDTMTIVATHTAPFGLGNNLSTPLAVSVDGKLWLPGGGLGYLDLTDNTFKNLPQTYGVYGDAYVGTADGANTLISPSFTYTPTPNWYQYKSADSTITNPMGDLQLSYGLTVSTDGSRILQPWVGELYNSSYDLLGQLPAPAAGESRGKIVLTPDGKRILAMVYIGSYKAIYTRIDVFDATKLQSGTTRFIKMGSIPITEQASVCAYNDWNCSEAGVLLPSSDNKTVFWIGNAKLQAFKLP